jgi:hypothetical protein
VDGWRGREAWWLTEMWARSEVDVEARAPDPADSAAPEGRAGLCRRHRPEKPAKCTPRWVRREVAAESAARGVLELRHCQDLHERQAIP